MSEPSDTGTGIDLREPELEPDSAGTSRDVIDLREVDVEVVEAEAAGVDTDVDTDTDTESEAVPGMRSLPSGERSLPSGEPEPGADSRPDSDLTTGKQPAAEEQPGLLNLDAYPMGPRGAVEAVLMVVDEPLAEATLASALGLPLQRVRELLGELAGEYDEAGRGFELRQVAGGWRIYSRAEYASVVERFMLDGQTAKLTQAALETLAIVAYRQPVSRARVGAVRGVNVDAVMRTLSSRGLVEEAGNDPESGAVLYRTTPYFLERIGLRSLDELPALAPYLPEVDVLDELGAGAPS